MSDGTDTIELGWHPSVETVNVVVNGVLQDR